MADDAWKPGADGSEQPPAYVPLRLVTNALTALQLGMIGSQVAQLAAELLLRVAEQDLPAEAAPETIAGLALLAIMALAALGLLAFMLLGMPVWMYWHWRAAQNLRGLGVALQHSPGWHVGWWFVPFANLVKPYHAMSELYAESTRGDGPSGQVRPPIPPHFVTWWGCWLIGNIAGNLSFRMWDSPDASLVVAMISVPFSTVATLLYLKFVREIAAGQERRVTAKAT